MAMDSMEARSMLDASRMHPDLITQIVPAPLTFKVDKTIIKLLRENYMGDILSVDLTSHLGGFVNREEPMHWRYDRDFSGYNIMHMGIWYETLMRWIGPASSVSTMNRIVVPSRENKDDQRQVITVPDHVEILALHLDVPSMTLSGGRRGDKRMSPIDVAPSDQAAWRVEEEFVNAIRGKEKILLTSFEDGVRYMEFTEAVTRSAQEQRTVSLPL